MTTNTATTRRAVLGGGVILGAATTVSGLLPASWNQRAAASETLPIGIVVAMEDELRHLLDQVTAIDEESSGPWRMRTLEYAGLPIVAMHSGIGMINAAACTEHLLATHRLRGVLNFGSAGAHVPDLLPGDVVIGSATVNQAMFVVLPDGQNVFPDADSVSYGETIPAGPRRCDPVLVKLARASAANWSPDWWPVDLSWPADEPRRTPVVAAGVVASSDIWNQNPQRIALIHSRLDSLCEDMEAAAVNQVCHTHGVPFLTVKDISNNELLASSDLQGENEALPAAEVGSRSAALILRLLDAIAE